MTSKEFKRRIESYSSLNRAAYLFALSSDINSIFKITLVYINKSVLIDYSVHCHMSDMDSDFCQSVWFDRFSRSDFDIQFKYFMSFYLRCSKYQRSIINESSSLSSLVERLNSEICL